MLLPLCNHQTSLPPQTLQNPCSPQLSLFQSPLPKTLLSRNPKTPPKLLHPRYVASGATADDTQTVSESAIKRIADKLRSLGYVEDDKEESKETVSSQANHDSPGKFFIPLPSHLPKYRVGHTFDPSWSTPENRVPDQYKEKKKGEARERVPTLAELTLPREELRRLRTMRIELKKKLKLGKAGITEGIVNGIHERWRSSELVKLVCEDINSMNMKRTHDLLERKTGGLVVWRSGGNIILYRGANYKYPYFLSNNNSPNCSSAGSSPNSTMDFGVHDTEESFSSGNDGISSAIPNSSNKITQPPLIQGVGSPNRVRFQLPGESQLAEVADCLLDGLGPRFTDWWGYDPLPVDADLLPAIVSGYRKPFRLLPYGVKPVLTNDEMTIIRRLGRPLPCHFVLGRNRKLEGLAASIVKLWEKCEIVKIAVKRGVQDANSELMAEELKWLTGGNLISRDKEFIVLYRGKDFLPAAVSSAIEERRKTERPIEKHRTYSISSATARQEYRLGTVNNRHEDECDGKMDQERYLVSEQRGLRFTEAATKSTTNKLQMTLEKKAKAEKLLAELEREEIPQEYEIDKEVIEKEGITEEERFMLRKVGLRMNPFLLLGRRGVFDGTVENMHLHWKYRELVKVICGGRSIEDVHRVANTLEAESGGILVAVERVSKGYAIIVYRGKNYKRPASLRPQTLLSKREAMKRSLEAQRRKSLKLHVLKLRTNVDELQLQLATKDEGTHNKPSTKVSNFQFQVARETSGADSSFFNSDDGIDDSTGTPETIQRDILSGSSLSFKDEKDHKTTELEPLSESELCETNVLKDMNGQGGDAESADCPDDFASQGQTCVLQAVNADPQVRNEKAPTPSVESFQSATEIPVHGVAENISTGVPSRALWLSNRERLLLRKQALAMKKLPAFAVGRSNIVAGVAKAIKEHFRKHSLAIVNVKGRANGTSVQELVFKLEQATGAVLVSRETNKVILYKGWGAEEVTGRAVEKNTVYAMRTSVGTGAGVRPVVSPELMSAIRLECGMQSSQEEEKAQQAGMELTSNGQRKNVLHGVIY